MSKNRIFLETSLYKNPQGTKNQFLRISPLFSEKAVDRQFLSILFHAHSLLSEIIKNMRRINRDFLFPAKKNRT